MNTKICIGMIVAISIAMLAPEGADAQSREYRPRSLPTITNTDPDQLQNSGLNDAEMSQFRTTYLNAGAPRVVVFLNKNFADLMADWTATEKVELDTSKTLAGTYNSENQDVQVRTRSIITQFARKPQPKRRSPSEVSAARFEAALNDMLLNVPVRLVDRSAIMRREGLSAKDIGDAEMRAMERHADILAELLFINDPFSSGGFSVQVRALRVEDGSFMGSGLVEPSASGDYQATRGGFERTVKADPRQLGKRTAEELVRLLQRGLMK